MLSETDAATTGTTRWNDTEPTTVNFSLGTSTYVNGNTSANVSTITIKTSANCYGIFANGCTIQSSALAQDADHTNSGYTTNHSNTFMLVGTVTGAVSNVVPSLANGLISTAGSGYLTTPTVTITAPNVSEQAAVAVATVVGEDSTSGGNVNAKYITRRVTLEDGFDAADIKVILNAYKPLGTNLYLYYKVKAEDDKLFYTTPKQKKKK